MLIKGFTIVSREKGVEIGLNLVRSNNCTIAENIIAGFSRESGSYPWKGLSAGIISEGSCNNTITQNVIMNNYKGIEVPIAVQYSDQPSLYNQIMHNIFVNNTKHTEGPYDSVILRGKWHDLGVQVNYWDDGMEGNFWDNYAGIDQNQDGIGDSPVGIGIGNKDNYPFVGFASDFAVMSTESVEVVSNSIVEGFSYSSENETITMYVSKMTESQRYGFCKICIPRAIMNVTNVAVIIDGGSALPIFLNCSYNDNSTHRWVFFLFEQSSHRIEIIPEFSLQSTLLVLFALASGVSAVKRFMYHSSPSYVTLFTTEDSQARRNRSIPRLLS